MMYSARVHEEGARGDGVGGAGSGVGGGGGGGGGGGSVLGAFGLTFQRSFRLGSE